eukprot:Pgem_evm1s18627
MLTSLNLFGLCLSNCPTLNEDGLIVIPRDECTIEHFKVNSNNQLIPKGDGPKACTT